VWADARVCYPLHAQPYTPASHFPAGRSVRAFRTKPQLAAVLVGKAIAVGFRFAAVVADCAYGGNDTFRHTVGQVAGLPYVLALKPNKGMWGQADGPHTPVDAARRLVWGGPSRPGAWQKIQRRFRDGYTQTWWAADAVLGGWGPWRRVRLVVATTNPNTLPENSTWYLLTNRPRPGSPRQADSPHPAADLAEVVRCYGLTVGISGKTWARPWRRP
jgi:hypothetical protein